MGEVIPFKKPKLSQKHKGNTLCKNGFHKWVIENEKTFDTRQGRLVTSYVCKRCDATKNSAK
ncbi:MAG: hypothetical protein OEM38_00940 [Gammaproteobacteria bacterium]|nr:hypothetical protein [Gammaproteobacteria bacterium]